MMSLIQQIRNGQLWEFHGGIHPPENKALSNQTTILPVEIPEVLILPIKQHIGQVGKVLVNVGDYVLKGQRLTETNVFHACPIHAPTSGKIIGIEPHPTSHPSGLTDTCIVIKPDHQDTWGKKVAIADYSHASPEYLIEHISSMGIAGMGGAGFPTARKMQSSFTQTEILILNGAECEPYITADDRLMRECAAEIAEGIQILQHIIKPKCTILAVEDNKPEAIAALTNALSDIPDTIIKVIPTKYPSGGEKQLIRILTGKEVPNQSIPAAIGMMMQNVGTAFAIKRAVIDGEPLLQRIVTVTGQQASNRGNRWTLIGTPLQFLMDKHGVTPDKKHHRVIIGGPMMGFTVSNHRIPITKTTNCLLIPSHREIQPPQQEMACIRCSACADVCPASLMPQQLQWYAKANDYNKCQQYHLADCIECGACAYVCPSQIPLVQYYRQAKANIRSREADAIAADKARQRFEAKKTRLGREKIAREEKHKKAAEQRRQAMATSDDGDQIAAAIARVKAKQTEVDSQSSETKPAVAAAIARAKAKQAAAQANKNSEPDNTEMKALREERKRVAREKQAEKTAQVKVTQDTPSPSVKSSTDKKQAVTDAVARAKARRAALAAKQQVHNEENKNECLTSSTPVSETPSTDVSPIKDDKKAAVAAAIARAKARKAAQLNKEE